MAITAAMCNSFKLDQLNGLHQAADVYKIALYTSAATLSKATTAYTATGEASGTGYTAGGATLAGRTAQLFTDTACLDFTDPVWANATITARGALIYNATRANAAVAVFDFGADITSTAASFTVDLPVPAAATSCIRLA